MILITICDCFTAGENKGSVCYTLHFTHMDSSLVPESAWHPQDHTALSCRWPKCAAVTCAVCPGSSCPPVLFYLFSASLHSLGWDPQSCHCRMNCPSPSVGHDSEGKMMPNTPKLYISYFFKSGTGLSLIYQLTWHVNRRGCEVSHCKQHVLDQTGRSGNETLITRAPS